MFWRRFFACKPHYQLFSRSFLQNVFKHLYHYPHYHLYYLHHVALITWRLGKEACAFWESQEQARAATYLKWWLWWSQFLSWSQFWWSSRWWWSQLWTTLMMMETRTAKSRPLLPRMIMIVIMVKNMTLVMVTSDHGLLLHLLRITEQVQSWGGH